MPAGISLPAAWVVGEKVKASKWNAYWAAVNSKFSGGIFSGDISAVAGIKGSQLSTAAGQRVGLNNIEDGAITNVKLRADAAPGSANAAVKRDNIVDGEVTSTKVALASIARDKLKFTVATDAYSYAVVAGNNLATITGLDNTYEKTTYQIIGTYIENNTKGQASINVDTSDPTYYSFDIVVGTLTSGTATGNVHILMLNKT